MTRRKFSREFKTEAVKLVTERGVSAAQAARYLDVAESVLRRRMWELPRQLRRFQGKGKCGPIWPRSRH
ncbi:transposase [Paracoccus niistensis]|uniref:Transposase n=1 Tax=Paracoccus niistensis TaxID=632935 RepID=A0ABV6I579_9RHOB